jgi:hypothetical protein
MEDAEATGPAGAVSWLAYPVSFIDIAIIMGQ